MTVGKNQSREPFFRHWLKGVRLYIAAFSLLLSLELWWWIGAVNPTPQLAQLRLEEVYAWLGVGFLAFALLIGPLAKTFNNLPGKGMLFESRRMLGIAAAWFCGLHAAIAYFGVFRGQSIFSLPRTYAEAFWLGTGALLILLAMAATSFDAAIRRMGKWWFRLHRLVYVAAGIGILHAFMIGAQATTVPVLVGLTVVSLLVLGFHAYLAFVKRQQPTIWQLITICYAAYLLFAVFNYGYSQHLGYNPLEKGHSRHGE